jgi:glutamate synthase domain-containing protein 3
LQTVLYCVPGKACIVFFTGESFFLSGSSNFAVGDQCSGAIVVISGDSKNVGCHELSVILSRISLVDRVSKK